MFPQTSVDDVPPLQYAVARPAIYGAVFLAGLTALRALFVLLGALRDPRLALPALGAVAAAALAGAGGGLIYAFLGRPLLRVRTVGPYLAGVVAAAGYLVCVLAMAAAAGALSVSDNLGRLLLPLLLVATPIGLVVGHRLLRPSTPQR